MPYNLYFENKTMNKKMLNLVINQLYDGLKGFFEYRESNINNKDTYISFISNENIIFLKYDVKLNLYDVISLEESKLYKKIEDISDSCFFQD